LGTSLTPYCNWGLAQVDSDRWRQALQIANQVAIDQFLELNTILQHPKVAVQLMMKNKVAPGIALQFVSNIKNFQREMGNLEAREGYFQALYLFFIYLDCYIIDIPA